MDKEVLKKAFREWKKEAGADYARTEIDSLGDCMSCVNAALARKYGGDSTGIYLKWWTRGMNKYGDLNDFEREDYALIGHDITTEQADKFYEVMSKYFNVTPKAYDHTKCFNLYEKGTAVYEVKYKYEWNGIDLTSREYYTKLLDATDAMNRLFREGTNATVTRIY